MKREPLDLYDILPDEMIDYLENYGRHFNKKLCSFAVKQMKVRNSSTGRDTSLTPMTREAVDNLLSSYNITLKNNQLYDYVYVANMCKADFFGKSVPDEEHMAMYIKDVIDDVDGPDGFVFNRWYHDMRRAGIAIPWYDVL